MKTTRFWWLRHAPVPDPEGRIVGRLDLPCDTSESDCFAALAKRLPRCPVLVESGLMRCAQTTAALEAAGMVLPPAVIEAGLVEQHFGRWQGHPWNELVAAKDPDLPGFWQNPAIATPPGGESFAAMVERVRAVIDRLSEDHPDRDLLCVAHAGTIRAAMAVALDMLPEAALRLAVEPLSLTRIDAIGESWRVGGLNWLPD